MICKICSNPVARPDAETCGEACRLKLDCMRIAWDREAKKVGVNGYYDRRWREHVRTHNTRGAKTMLKEWRQAKERLGERP